MTVKRPRPVTLSLVANVLPRSKKKPQIKMPEEELAIPKAIIVDTSKPISVPPDSLGSVGRFFTLHGKTVFLRGVNLSGSTKAPTGQSSHQPLKPGSFVGRPFALDEAEEHFERLQNWGFNFLRFNVVWEALEGERGVINQEYCEYVCQILLVAKKYGFKCFIDPHQDVWSRYTGGSGAPLWTLELAGFDVSKFVETQAALVHSTYPDPANYPKMIWPTNYFKLACFTMFTLFFGGDLFAPSIMVEGVSIQKYLQKHYFTAISTLAQAIKDTEGLQDSVVVGYDTLNEPSLGLIGVEDLGVLAHQQELRKGATPSPFQAMKLGMGMLTEKVQIWDMTSIGPQKVDEKTFDPKGAKAWASCIWAKHGVWDSKTGKLLKRDYFLTNPKTGDIVDGLTDFWKPFVNEYAKAIRAVHSSAIIFIEPPVNAFPPIFNKSDVQNGLCFAPHWYDGLTLLYKSWNPWFNVDYVGFTRGKYSSIAFAIKFGTEAITNCFQSQLRTLREEGELALGAVYPTIIGEIGIPYDMDGKAAYKSNDYTSQIRALDANMTALERDLLNFTLWNYCSDNNHKWGDNWNGEDLSIWAAPIAPKILSPGEQVDLNVGGRATAAFCRPYAISTPGIPKSMHFDLQTTIFTYTYSHGLCEDGESWDPKYYGILDPVVEIYVPRLHYTQAEDMEVFVSCGTFKIDMDKQRVEWRCGCKIAEDTGAATTTSSLNSNHPLVELSPGDPKKANTVDPAVHKIVIRRTDSEVIGNGLDDDEDDDAICPECAVM